MVLSRRAESGTAAAPSVLKFDGSDEMDVEKFLFVYDNVAMRDKTDIEKAADLLCYLEGKAFDFYYETFARDGSLTDEAKNYGTVRAALVEHFAAPVEPEDSIRQAIAARLSYDDLTGSLQEMDRLFEKASFNSEARFGLLRNAVMQFPDLAQFAIYRGATTYDALKLTVKDFVAGRNVFFSSQRMSQTEQAVGSKKILQRPDALERKVDTLTDQLAQLSLLVKKNQGSSSAGSFNHGRLCSYCKRQGHGANRCDVNPYRDHKCPRCGKFGHAETSCWMKITPEMTRKVGFRDTEDDSKKEKRPDQVTVVTESGPSDVVAAAKRNAAGEALPKQAKTASHVPIQSLLNASPSSAPMLVEPAPMPRVTTRTRRQKPKGKKKIKTHKVGIADHVGKYDVMTELARAPSGLTFGQLIRGDAEAAKVEIRKVLSKSARSGRTVIAQVADGAHHRRLKVVSVKVYGTVAQALLDSGAVPNLMSSSLASALSLSPEPTTKKITVADGSNAVVRGFLTGIPVRFDSLHVHLDFLVIEGTPVDIIIGCPALEMLQARLDMGEQHVTITIGEQSVQMGFEHDQALHRVQEDGTDSEDFTSASEDEDSDTEEEDEGLVVALLDEAPFEPDINQSTPVAGVSDKAEGRGTALLFEKVRHLPSHMQEVLVEKLEASGIVAKTLDDIRPANVPVEHGFELTDNNPIHFTARRLPPRHNEVVRRELDKMLDAGIIKPSASAWSFPVVIATKKDGKPRFCVDYRTLNKRMVADRWPLPKIEEIFDDLEGSRVFTTIDLFSGYWQVRMAEHCKEKTSFACRYGTFQFEVMPFGLMNAPSTFQRMMDFVFRDLDFVRCYVDDVVVHSRALEEHVTHLMQVIDRISTHGLKLKLSKSSFAQSRVKLLGHVVDKSGVSVDSDKIKAIAAAPIPQNTTELRSFLGLAGYYRRFIKGFAEISGVLHEATSAKKDFAWTQEMRVAFDTLKNKLTSPPVLAFPDFELPFVVETDASSVAVGAVLSQKKEDGKIHPIQYASRTMTAAERNYSACEREALAVIFALKKFRVYLLSSTPFKLITDHQALRYAFQKRDIHGRLARWMDFLAEYSFDVTYRAGSSNAAADYLSRIEISEGEDDDVGEEGDLRALAVSIEMSHDVNEIPEDIEPHLQDTARYLLGRVPHETDEQMLRFIKRHAKQYLLWNQMLFRRTKRGLRVVVPERKRVSILRTLHDDLGHWDLEATKDFVASRYWWPTIGRDIYDYVKSCDGCQFASSVPKYRTALSIPITSIFDTFSIDFAGPFEPSKNGSRFILVAVEHLTGWPIAQATPRSTADVVINFITREILHQFGAPRRIISDNATSFTAATVEEFMKEHGIKWKTVLAYAPMSNGKAERMVGTLKRSIKKMVLAAQRDWEEALDQVLFGYRRRRMASGVSPFELMYGVRPRMDNAEPRGLIAEAESREEHRMFEVLGVQPAKAQRTSVISAAPKCPTTKFEVGQEVLLAKGQALGPLKWPSFSSKFKGPYRIAREQHPRYQLVSASGRVSRRAVHARRLILYRRRPFHLEE